MASATRRCSARSRLRLLLAEEDVAVDHREIIDRVRCVALVDVAERADALAALIGDDGVVLLDLQAGLAEDPDPLRPDYAVVVFELRVKEPAVRALGMAKVVE